MDYAIQQVLKLVSNQNAQIRENSIQILQVLFTVISTSSIQSILTHIMEIAMRTGGMYYKTFYHNH